MVELVGGGSVTNGATPSSFVRTGQNGNNTYQEQENNLPLKQDIQLVIFILNFKFLEFN